LPLRRCAVLSLSKEGRVIQRVMLGDKNVDLSGLPEEWRKTSERMKDSG
jgi:hypothetical protein